MHERIMTDVQSVHLAVCQTNATTLRDAATKQWVKQAEKELPASPFGLRVINQQLWCCGFESGVVVLDPDFQQASTCTAAGRQDAVVFVVAQLSSGDVIVAEVNGLYHIFNGLCCVVCLT